MFGEIITVYYDSCKKHKNIHVVKIHGFYARSLASSCLSVCLSVRPSVRMEHLGAHQTDFRKIWYLGIFSRTCPENSCFIKSWQEWGVLYMKTNIRVWYLAQFFSRRETFQTKVVHKIKTHSIFNNNFPKVVPFIRYVKKILQIWRGHR